MSDKLQNIKAVKEMIEGRHFTQTKTNIGFSDIESVKSKTQERAVGETWEEYDKDGNVKAVWEQRDGYKIKKGRNAKILDNARDYLTQYKNCIQDYDKCKSTPKTKLDERFRNKFGRCSECQFKLESEMKLNGTYKEYERGQMLKNANAFFKQADKEIEIVYNDLVSDSYYANVDGATEKWEGDMKMAEDIKREYTEYKEIVLDKLKNMHNEKTSN